MGIITAIIGITLLLYGNVVSVHDSTVKAMGATAAKGAARFLGFLLTVAGIAMAFMGA